MMNKVKVSFDFDDTLDHKSVQKFVQEIKDIAEVHITTSRYDDVKKYLPVVYEDHNDLYRVADRLGILRENIHFTDMADKADWFNEHKELDFKFHLDNDRIEILLINSNTPILGVDFTLSNWKEKCLKSIQEWKQ